MLDALESLPLVCLDSLEAIAGNALWERALFDFTTAGRRRARAPWW